MAPSLSFLPGNQLTIPNGLTADQLASYHENGYLLLPHSLDLSTISALLAETNHLLATFPLSTHPLTKFTTGEFSSPSPHVSDDYFLTSSDKIRFFLEPAAFDPTTNHLSRPPHQAVNKIGHYLHELSPVFRAATLTPPHAAIARALGFHDPRVLQSMVICKQAGIGGAVPPHQDSTFLYTDPPSAVGFWIALEDAGGENGGLSFARGSHRRVGVRKRFVRTGGGVSGTEFVEVDGRRFPEGEGNGEGGRRALGEGEGKGDAEAEEYTLEEVRAGTLVLIHGNLLHKSECNLSGKSRFIYTFHVIEGEHQYDRRNWLQPPEKGFSRLY